MFVCIAHACCQPTPPSILCACRLQPVRTFFDQKQNRLNFIDVRRMSVCGMLQAQGQNAMQFKCVQISLDDYQTSQQTLVQ